MLSIFVMKMDGKNVGIAVIEGTAVIANDRFHLNKVECTRNLDEY
jgi:predicted oxidoreductase